MTSSGTKVGKGKNSGPTPAQILLGFFSKVLIPLIALALVSYCFCLFINLEISGVYNGRAPGLGAVQIFLQEEGEYLKGNATIGQDRYFIDSGKMLNSSDLKIELKQENAPAKNKALCSTELSEPQTETKTFKERNDSISLASIKDNESKGGAGSAIESTTTISIEARKEGMNELAGKIYSIDSGKEFRAYRNSFSTLFGTRWLRVLLSYIGIKQASL